MLNADDIGHASIPCRLQPDRHHRTVVDSKVTPLEQIVTGRVLAGKSQAIVAQEDAPAHHLIAMDDAGEYRRKSYGVLFQSRNVWTTNRSHAPTRLVVWDNTNRPNADAGKAIGDTLTVGDRKGNTVTEYSVKYTHGQFLDPHNEPTDDPVTILLSTESSAICTDTRFNTGQPASGQVYAPGRWRDGDTATLIYPDGSTIVVDLHLPPHHNGHGYATLNRPRQ